MLPIALGKSAMVKDNLGPPALLYELEFRDRINPRIPASRAPCLHDSLVRHELDMPSRYISAEERKRAARFTADLRRFSVRRHPGLHRRTQVYHFVELLCLRQRFIHALPARLEHWLHVNGFRRSRNLLLGSGPSPR